MHTIPICLFTIFLSVSEQDSDDRMLVDFDEPNVAQTWITVNDNVMGGRSKGGPAFADGILTFSGSTNTNGGGFSSIRTRPRDWNLDEANGLIVRVRGDGRTYKADMLTDQRIGNFPVAFRADFETKAGEWQEIRIPFAKFIGTIFGQPVGDRARFDKAKVETLGFMIYDGKDGPFQLEVDWIKAY